VRRCASKARVSTSPGSKVSVTLSPRKTVRARRSLGWETASEGRRRRLVAGSCTLYHVQLLIWISVFPAPCRCTRE
jgi:hypothetical protein